MVMAGLVCIGLGKQACVYQYTRNDYAVRLLDYH
jgi:hypothetical protein